MGCGYLQRWGHMKKEVEGNHPRFKNKGNQSWSWIMRIYFRGSSPTVWCFEQKGLRPAPLLPSLPSSRVAINRVCLSSRRCDCLSSNPFVSNQLLLHLHSGSAWCCNSAQRKAQTSATDSSISSLLLAGPRLHSSSANKHWHPRDSTVSHQGKPLFSSCRVLSSQ